MPQDSTTAATSRATTDVASSEEVRALISVMWELVNRFDRVLQKFEIQPNDPRYKPPTYTKY